MARKICITEEQYNMALKEGVKVNADLSATNGNVGAAFDNAKKDAKESGLKDGEYSIEFPNVTESKFITKKQLQENRLKALKEDSELYTVKDFMKRFVKK